MLNSEVTAAGTRTSVKAPSCSQEDNACPSTRNSGVSEQDTHLGHRSHKQGCSSHPAGSKHGNSVTWGRFMLCATQFTFTYYIAEHRFLSLHMCRTAEVKTLNPEIHPAPAPWILGNICHTWQMSEWEISLLKIVQQQAPTTYLEFLKQVCISRFNFQLTQWTKCSL